MPKGAPQVIITDQDPAMTKAISKIPPQTIHRYCIWHILNKCLEKVGTLNYCDNYQFFKSVIVNSETTETFETSWLDLLQRPKLQDNACLCQLYDIHSKWVPAFVNKYFNAGMSSNQSTESSHSFLKKHFKENFINGFHNTL